MCNSVVERLKIDAIFLVHVVRISKKPAPTNMNCLYFIASVIPKV